MNELSAIAVRWLLHVLVGGGLLLLVTCLLMRWTSQPARRQRLGDWGVAAALLVALLSLIGPSWLVIPWDPGDQPPRQLAWAAKPAIADDVLLEIGDAAAQPLAAEIVDEPLVAEAVQPTQLQPDIQPASWAPLARMALVIAFAAVAVCFAIRLLLGYIVLLRLVVRAESAPAEVHGLFETMAAGTRWVRLLVSRRLLVPLSCGLMRPTVVLPAAMCTPPAARQLRWVFAHELTHLRRRDAWSALLFSVGQIFFFALPWFWWLRRQVRLCQEYVADAAAARQDEAGVEYAAFLVSLVNAPPVPAGAAAVSPNCSDLLRRVTMLLNDSLNVETRCPRRWTALVAVGLLSLAVVLSGVGYRAEASPQEAQFKIVIQPDDAKAKAKAEPPPAVKFFLTQPEGKKDKLEENYLLYWHAVPADDKGKGSKDGTLIIKDVIIESVGPAQQWAFKVGQADNLLPLHEAMLRLERLKAEGKLTNERIEAEVKKALQQMKAQPAKPAFDKPIVLELKLDKDGQLSFPKGFEFKVEPAKPKAPQIILQLKDGNAKPEAVQKALKLHLDKQGSVKGAEIEVIPLQKDGKTPQKVQGPEDLKKMLLKLEGLKLDGKDFILEFPSQIQKPRFGVAVEGVPAVLSEHLGLPAKVGLLVTEVVPNSPADKAGIKAKDVLIKIDGAMVPSSVEDFGKLLSNLKTNTAMDVIVVRKGIQMKCGSVKLVSAAGENKVLDKYTEALADLEVGIALLEEAQLRYDRIKQLLPKGNVTEKDIAMAKATVEKLSADLKAKKAALDRVKSDMLKVGEKQLILQLVQDREQEAMKQAELAGKRAQKAMYEALLGKALEQDALQHHKITEEALKLYLDKAVADKETVTMTVTRKGDTFTAKHVEDIVTITVRGTFKDGRIAVEGVEIASGPNVRKYQSIATVPETFRPRVQQIVGMLQADAQRQKK